MKAPKQPTDNRRRLRIAALAAITVMLLCFAALFSSCGEAEDAADQEKSLDGYLSIVDDEPDTLDPQCTTEFYTVPLNVFDRLVNIEVTNQNTEIIPSLAESWTVSEDGLIYTFRLHRGVTFSNGAELTSEDVEYTFKRLLTYKNSCNQDIVMNILGARAFREGKTKYLRGFNIIDHHTFSIELEHPYAAFLACLATPGASILDKETTRSIGAEFGLEPGKTIGTGPFVVEAWDKGERMLLAANPNCWSGAPKCDGVKMILDSGEISHIEMFNDGEIDILDLDMLDTDAEYFARGDIYLKHIVRSTRVGISYLTFNESIAPLDNLKVRKALQYALDRKLLLKAILSGRGRIENGIFPYGLVGHNPKLKEIPYDTNKAKQLLADAGYGDGFDLEIDCPGNAPQNQRALLDLVAYMWGRIGVNATIREIDSDKYYKLRDAGKLVCYTGTWSADYDDPGNFIFTFFGNVENTTGRSLCYQNRAIMDRVKQAEQIVDEKQRILEYQKLEKVIVQDEAAWIPLYSRQHLFVISDRVEGFTVLWNGWSNNIYRDVTVLNRE